MKYTTTAAYQTSVRIDGAILVRLEGRDRTGCSRTCAVMVYVSPDAHGFYLLREAMTQLGIIANDFPMIGAEGNAVVSANESSPQRTQRQDSRTSQLDGSQTYNGYHCTVQNVSYRPVCRPVCRSIVCPKTLTA